MFYIATETKFISYYYYLAEGGQLKLDLVAQAIRATGGVPTEAELNTILSELVNVDKASISFLEFWSVELHISRTSCY